jgi:hypothetical protein
MTIRVDQDITNFFIQKIKQAKVTFERAVDCKHTDFDDLYPYMSEHPQFFWYKRYVAWQELLTLTSIAEELGLNWNGDFNDKQVGYIKGKVMEAKVLDHWFDEQSE